LFLIIALALLRNLHFVLQLLNDFVLFAHLNLRGFGQLSELFIETRCLFLVLLD